MFPTSGAPSAVSLLLIERAFQRGDQFARPVMFLLALHVVDGERFSGCAERERAVATLPLKFRLRTRQQQIDLARRLRLGIAHPLRHRNCGRD